jgi:hypothetical protein
MIGSLGWSNDGHFLIFGKSLISSPEMGNAELWRIRPKEGVPERMGVGGNLVTREPIRVHPKGGQIAFTRASKRAEIWTMEGFLSRELTSD